MNKKANFRFGIKVGGPLFPNMGIMVFKIDADLIPDIVKYVNAVKRLLILGGQGEVADKLIAEIRL
jgi:hypothetical protein